jgi:hypothetical protein
MRTVSNRRFDVTTSSLSSKDPLVSFVQGTNSDFHPNYHLTEPTGGMERFFTQYVLDTKTGTQTVNSS